MRLSIALAASSAARTAAFGGVEARTLFPTFGAADARILIDLDDLPAGACCNGLQLAALVAGFLLRSGDLEIDRDALHDPKPFTWTADPDKIVAAVKRGHQLLDLIH